MAKYPAVPVGSGSLAVNRRQNNALQIVQEKRWKQHKNRIWAIQGKIEFDVGLENGSPCTTGNEDVAVQDKIDPGGAFFQCPKVKNNSKILNFADL